MADFHSVPIIDILDPAASELVGKACREVGFFYASNYNGILSKRVQSDLDASCRAFFSLPHEDKMQIHMSKGGRAWRGYFPVGEELTSGVPDQKEGVYFGQETAATDAKVIAGTPTFGENLLRAPLDRACLLEYMKACEALGQHILSLIAISLSLPADFFRTSSCATPLCLFRAFNYPATPPTPGNSSTLPSSSASASAAADSAAVATNNAAAAAAPMLPTVVPQKLWSVGPHTDYGLLTLLSQDSIGGLEVKNRRGKWIPAPPVPDTLVINIGDMMEAITLGLYRSTLHRVLNPSHTLNRVSYPFFFDPGFDSLIAPLPLSTELLAEAAKERHARSLAGVETWDKKSPLDAAGKPYSEYLLGKLKNVFPDLYSSVAKAP